MDWLAIWRALGAVGGCPVGVTGVSSPVHSGGSQMRHEPCDPDLRAALWSAYLVAAACLAYEARWHIAIGASVALAFVLA